MKKLFLFLALLPMMGLSHPWADHHGKLEIPEVIIMKQSDYELSFDFLREPQPDDSIATLKIISHHRYPDFVKISLCYYQDFEQMLFRNAGCLDLHAGAYYQLQNLINFEQLANQSARSRRQVRGGSIIGAASLVGFLYYRRFYRLAKAAGANVKSFRFQAKLVGKSIIVDVLTDFNLEQIIAKAQDTGPLSAHSRQTPDDQIDIAPQITLIDHVEPAQIFANYLELLPARAGEVRSTAHGLQIIAQDARLFNCSRCYYLRAYRPLFKD